MSRGTKESEGKEVTAIMGIREKVKMEMPEQRGKGIVHVRQDGLKVFLSPGGEDKVLDHIRLTGEREVVIAMVAFRTAQIVALNYATKYAPDLVPAIKAQFQIGEDSNATSL